MTHRGGLSLSIIIWRRGAKFPFSLGPKNYLGGPDVCNRYQNTSSASDMFTTLNWPTLAECRLPTRIIMFYKIAHQLVVAIPSGTTLIPTN